MTEPLRGNADTPTPLNILIVDDSAVTRSVIKRVAELAGMPIGQVYEAADGQQALAILKQQDVDVLFTDICMPVMTGIELLQQIAGHERWRHMVRVVISTDGSDMRRDETEALDVRFYLEKPFRPEVMRDVLSDLIAAR